MSFDVKKRMACLSSVFIIHILLSFFLSSVNDYHKIMMFIHLFNHFCNFKLLTFNQIFFLILHKNTCCVYSLEASCLGASNEYPHYVL